MNTQKTVWLGLLVCLTLWGCGYQMAGRGASQLPPLLYRDTVRVFFPLSFCGSSVTSERKQAQQVQF